MAATSNTNSQPFGLWRCFWGSLWLLCAAGSQTCGGLDSPDAAAALCDPSDTGLTITEIMPYPGGGGPERQWIELTNLGSRPLALGRMTLSLGRPQAPRQHHFGELGMLAPGQIVVLGRGERAFAPIDVSYGELNMPHDAGIVALHCRGVRMTSVVYGSTSSTAQDSCRALDRRLAGPAAASAPCHEAPAPKAGASLSLELSPEGPPIWHRSVGPHYDEYNIGTPQAGNLGLAVCQSAAGRWRRARSPAAGEVRICAVYADPPGRDDGLEWLALRAVGQSAVDLSGLSMWAQVAGHRARRWLTEDTACWPVEPGEERVVRVLTAKMPAAASQAAAQAGDLLLWGPTLPNDAMHLAVGFHLGARQPHEAPWCDAIDIPKARRGVIYVTDVTASRAPAWPPLCDVEAPNWAVAGLKSP